MPTPEFQHCPTCDEEYVGSATTCVECGGPLTPGPLARLEHGSRDSAHPSPTATGAPLDRLLIRLPGKEADHAVRALLIEGISCRAVCEGLEKTYLPDRPPTEPFAVSLPVEVYVADDQLDAAQALLDSFSNDDLIGEQWDTDASDDAADSGSPESDSPPDTNATDAAPDDADADAIEPERTPILPALVIAAVLIGLLLFFAQ